MYSSAIVLGCFILAIGVLLMYVGLKTSKGKLVSWGAGMWLDRTGICMRAGLVLFIGALALAAGFLI